MIFIGLNPHFLTLLFCFRRLTGQVRNRDFRNVKKTDPSVSASPFFSIIKEHSAAFSLFEVNIYSIKLTNEPFSVIIALFLDRPKCGWGLSGRTLYL